MTRLGGACVGLLLLVLATLCASAASPKRVLILDPFGRDVAPFSTIISVFRTTLARELGEPVDIYELPLDLARFGQAEGEDSLVAFVEARIKSQPVDLVVPIGGGGVQFATRHRERLFSDAPVLVVGSAPQFVSPSFLRTNATLVTQPINLSGMVEDILQIQPQTTNVVVVLGASTLERYWVNESRREFQGFTNRVAFTWLNELPLPQILERCAALPPRSFILHGLFVVDAAGVPCERSEALRRLHETANAPLYGYFASEFGLGPVGGRLYQDAEVGAQGARAAIRILRGEKPGDIRPQILEAAAPVYDWRELRRWGISESQLPPGSRVLFREPTAWERYQGRIILAAVICFVQALLIVVLLQNLLSRRRMERTLAESRNHLRAILDTAVEGIITINERGIIQSVNAATEKIFGYTAAEMIGQNVGLLMPSLFREQHDQYLANFHRTHQPNIIGVGREVGGRRKDGSAFPLDLEVSEITLAGQRVFTGFVRDITERKRAEQITREFGGRLLHAQEAERARLARELHDDITQRLARLAIDAGRAESARSGAVTSELMREIRDGLVRLSEDVHTLSYKLHPALLEDLGLAEALKVECERFARQESIPVKVKLENLPAQLAHDTGLCLFRVTQEALRNVARHARAQSAEISLRPVDGGLQLAVTDAGAGFDPRQPRERPSLGLASMRERVRLLEGELDIDSAPGRGTTIVAWVPLKDKST